MTKRITRAVSVGLEYARKTREIRQAKLLTGIQFATKELLYPCALQTGQRRKLLVDN